MSSRSNVLVLKIFFVDTWQFNILPFPRYLLEHELRVELAREMEMAIVTKDISSVLVVSPCLIVFEDHLVWSVVGSSWIDAKPDLGSLYQAYESCAANLTAMGQSRSLGDIFSNVSPSDLYFIIRGGEVFHHSLSEADHFTPSSRIRWTSQFISAG